MVFYSMCNLLLTAVLFAALVEHASSFARHCILRKSAHVQSLRQPEPRHYDFAQLNLGNTIVRHRKQPLRDILGLGPTEIAITLVAALVLFGPETLKSLSKDVGKAAAELKEIPKTFKEGMDEGAEAVQVSKMKEIAAAKRKKRDAKVAAASAADDEDEDAEEDDA